MYYTWAGDSGQRYVTHFIFGDEDVVEVEVITKSVSPNKSKLPAGQVGQTA